MEGIGEKEVMKQEQKVDGEEEEMEDTGEKEDEEEAEEEEDMAALVDREGSAEEEDWKEEPNDEPANQLDQSDSPPSPPSPPGASGCAETLSHAVAETGNEARRFLAEEERGSGAAKNHSGDVYPTSPSSDKETEGAAAQTPTDTKSVGAEIQSSEEQERLETTPMTSFPAPGHRGETAADVQDITPELQTGCRLEEEVSSMDAAAESSLRAEGGSKELSLTPNSSVMEVKEDKEEGGQNSHNMNGEAGEAVEVDAADDKKNSSHQSSKYKTVSFKRIRRGNTRQRIDEFEAMMDF
ncbi:cilia- and flagella-associated protein 251-like [Sebastes umbrosus]|uniref:cilia- and flagella-associated protein 251-like n=1 Tax=Sebastes umbrosus TaxID=72105 RepID=UPI00189C7ECB|nr:cilia- and flagella-associated protein 251-like [Sebastes umbrosus]